MDKKLLKKRVDAMFHSVNTDEYIDRIIESDTINLDDWPNDYGLPKIILTAILRKLVNEYTPSEPTHRNHVDNITLHL